jgi:hypothetical protein
MGCDIHAHIEANQNGSYWEFAKVHIDRAYGLFAALADVRNSAEWGITPVAEKRGIPADSGDYVKIDYEEDCGHSASWLTYQECVTAYGRSCRPGAYSEVD